MHVRFLRDTYVATRASRGKRTCTCVSSGPVGTTPRLLLTEAVMSAWARLVADCRAGGITKTVRLTAALIAATAIAYELPVVTQDADYSRIAEIRRKLRVVQV